ncbi:MAG: hypothetical protein QXN71_02720 [Candidatus Aenigmatarchaeota archaeon]
MRYFIKEIFVLPVLFVIFASGCVQQDIQPAQQSPEIGILSFTTDKPTYSSHEEMKISVIVRSSVNIENATAKVYGIKPYNHAYVNELKIVNLSKGDNEITFFAKTPYCTSGCGGVYPGPYNLTAEILVNGELVANSTTTINLVKG